jgi:hypothetical protein
MSDVPSTAIFRARLTAMLLALACAGKQIVTPASPIPSGPLIFLHAPEVVARHKARYLADPRHPEPTLSRLLDEAREARAARPFSVTEKTALPPSGDKHDYLSLAPYAWPDPRKPNGLPYVIRDGKTNPEHDSIPDHAYFAQIVALTETLGLAYYFTDDESFAEHAALLLRTFFVEPATRMNPNLDFAQGVRGKENGRAAGIIDTAGIARLVDGVGLLAGSKSLLTTDRDGLLAWFRDYLTWLRESELGRRESRAGNNQGTWYDVQTVSLALATGQIDLAREILQFGHKRRIGRQIDPDGSQPEELQRTKSWHYAVYNLQAFVALANLGDHAGVDLWRYQTPDGRSISKAIAWLIPFALGQRPWTTPEIGGVKTDALWPIVREAAARLQDPRFAEAATRLGDHHTDRLWLLVE